MGATQRRIWQLAQDIHDLHGRKCKLARELTSIHERADRAMLEKCRVRERSDFPESRHFKHVFDWQDAMARTQKDPSVRSATQLAQVVLFVPLAFACVFAMRYTNSVLIIGLGMGVLAVAAVVLQNHFWLRPRVQKALRRQLIARGVPICLSCGYDLRGLDKPRCPECGSRFAASLVAKA